MADNKRRKFIDGLSDSDDYDVVLRAINVTILLFVFIY